MIVIYMKTDPGRGDTHLQLSNLSSLLADRHNLSFTSVVSNQCSAFGPLIFFTIAVKEKQPEV